MNVRQRTNDDPGRRVRRKTNDRKTNILLEPGRIPEFETFLDENSLINMSRVCRLTKAHYIGVANQIRAAKRGDVDALVQAVRDSGGVKHPSVAGFAVDMSRINMLAYLTEQRFPKVERANKVVEHIDNRCIGTVVRFPLDDLAREHMAVAAVRVGSMEMLEHATELGYPKSRYVVEAAIKEGRMDMLKYVTENGYPKDEKAAEYAIRVGRMDMLKYVTENGYPKEADAIEAAIKKGRNDMLQYMMENGYPESPFFDVVQAVIKKGRIDMLQCVTENGYPKDEKAAEYAIRVGRMDMLKYVTENGYPKRRLVVDQIVSEMGPYAENPVPHRARDQFLVDALVYVTETGYPARSYAAVDAVRVDPDRFQMPRRVGTPDHDGSVLGYLVANYPNMTTSRSVAEEAAEHVPEDLERVFDMGFPFTRGHVLATLVLEGADERGEDVDPSHLNFVMEHSHAENSPRFEAWARKMVETVGDLAEWAAEQNYFGLFKYATDHGYPKTSDRVAEWAVRNGNWNILVYATRNGYPKTNENVAALAEERSRSRKMLKYVVDHGYVHTTDQARLAQEPPPTRPRPGTGGVVRRVTVHDVQPENDSDISNFLYG